MKKRKPIIPYTVFILFLVAVGISWRVGFAPGVSAGKHFEMFFLEMIAFLPLMFILIGLFDVWFPREKVEKHIGKDAGVLGALWVILLAMLQAGPLYGAFPVAYMLWKKGCSIRNIFIYLGAFATIKIPMLTFEIGFMGIKFSLLRTAITLPVFVAIAWLMEQFFRNRDFSISDPSQPITSEPGE